ncbi:hypothetical protein STVA_09940 [Allostella vacuolata]|nr:hypothetical protein STVA_09940 [Stella vacuolata]
MAPPSGNQLPPTLDVAIDMNCCLGAAICAEAAVDASITAAAAAIQEVFCIVFPRLFAFPGSRPVAGPGHMPAPVRGALFGRPSAGGGPSRRRIVYCITVGWSPATVVRCMRRLYFLLS